jgi:hypothetical protein
MDEIGALLKEAQQPKTTPERLAELATHAHDDVRRAAARNANLPAASLSALLDDKAWEVQIVAAHNKHAPSDRALALVAKSAASPTATHRRLAARSPLASAEDLERLTTDPDPETRSNACKNPRTNREISRRGLTDAEPCVVLGALSHPSLPKDERRAFVTEELVMRFFEGHADQDYLFEALCERYLWEVLERAWPDPEKFDDVWQELVGKHFELVEISSKKTVMAAVHREHWPAIAKRIADEVRGGPRRQD